MINRLLDLAIQIQQIPSPTFDEKRRAEFVQALFLREKLQDVSLDSVCNVFGRLPGNGRSKPLIVTAHLDTVFPRDTELHSTRAEDRIYGPGIGDNSLGIAALVGLLWMIRQQKTLLEGDVWFVSNVSEEGLGDLRGMKAVVNRFGGEVQAYLVIEGTALGHIYHRAVGVRRYRISARTEGGHSWSDYGQPSAVHELAHFVTQITALPIPSSPRTTLNVGLISGGTGVNVLASYASLELDLRSENIDSLNALIARVEEKIRAANRPGVTLEMEIIGDRPAGELPVDHPLVKLAEECLLELGLKASFTSGSTDANIPLSLGYPALVLGVTTGGSAHTVHEYIEVAPVEKGMQQLINFVSRIWGKWKE
jgi:tripeptide aminopeptidase